MKKLIHRKINIEINDLLNQWNNLQIINIEQMSKDYYSIYEKDFGLISFFDEIWMFGKLLSNMVWDNKYDSYYKTIDYAYALLVETKAKLNIYLTKMFNTINGINIAIKFKKFDNEIDQYKSLIEQKQKELDSSPLVVSRKIDILKDKIQQTLNLKNQFIVSSKQRSKEEFEDFKLFVSSLFQPKSNNSLNKVIDYQNQDELDKLKVFVKKYWVKITNYLNLCIDVLNKLKQVKVK